MSKVQQSNLLLAGAGLSGLTLALECAKRPFFQDKKIVLIDRDDKSRNDRTWCFWAKDDEPLPLVDHKIWNQCQFFGKDIEKILDISPYRYHMIRGLDFYNWAKTELAKYPNVQRVTANILDIDAENGIIRTDLGDYQGEWIFNSARFTAAGKTYAVDGARWTSPKLQASSINRKSAHSFLLQHFKGWIIETPSAAFNPETVTFMDYRLDQHGETRFVYVLPFSKTRALVEFTVFSPELCPPETYENELKRYLSEVLKITDFHIEEEEFGVIPMTDLTLSPKGEGRVINIGTAGGFVKASSGYAFLRTQRKVRSFVNAWEKTGTPDPSTLQSSQMYRAFDSIMLHVLQENLVSGKDFFSLLFKKLPAPLVLRFLDEDASWGDIFRVLYAPPSWPFLKTALRQMPFLLKL
ncbi:MAG: lycopene cyclase family protein [Saprospiraceae bacterium]